MASRERPTGVTILAILEALGGVLYLLGAFAVAWLLPMLMMMPGGPPPEAVPFMVMFAGLFWVIAAVLVALALISFVLAYGLWTGKGWGWTLAVILSIIGILVGLASLPGGVLGLIINAVILYYLFRPHVKEFFGKGAATPPPPPPP